MTKKTKLKFRNQNDAEPTVFLFEAPKIENILPGIITYD